MRLPARKFLIHSQSVVSAEGPALFTREARFRRSGHGDRANHGGKEPGYEGLTFAGQMPQYVGGWKALVWAFTPG